MNEDLLSVASRDTELKRTSSHRGGEYHGPCPFCGGQDRFRVQPEYNFWACRQCGKSGDLIAYLVDTNRISKTEAYKRRNGDQTMNVCTRNRTRRLPSSLAACEPPNSEWQARARRFIKKSHRVLLSDDGSKALAWLEARGLSRDTVIQAGLGLHTGNPEYEKRRLWGLPTKLNAKGNPKKIWLPLGITIPWKIDDDIWRVNIRQPQGDPKYIGPAGWSNALYNADRLGVQEPAIMVEGEFDALLLHQFAGDLVAPVATGSTGGARMLRWAGRLAMCPRVLVAFDADDAGDEAREHWLRILPNGKRWRPFWGDVTTMYKDGFDLRAWIEEGLE